MKKILALIIVIVLFIAVLSSCGSRPSEEQGEIDKIEIEEVKDNPDTKKDPIDIFTPIESPFPYKYRKFTNPRAFMSFDVPENWGITPLNSRLIRIDTPKDDPNLPGITINVFHDYTHTTDGENFLHEDDANGFSRFYQDTMYHLEFTIDGKNCIPESFKDNADDIADNAAFCGEDNAISFQKRHNVHFLDLEIDDYLPEGYTWFNTYIRFNTSPTLFSTVITPEKEDVADKMIRYIISTIKKVEKPIDALRTETLNDVVITMPKEFEPYRGSKNIYLSPVQDIYSTSGMTISCFDLKTTDGETFTNETTRMGYMQNILEMVLPINDPSDFMLFNSVAKEKDITISGHNASVYYGAQTFKFPLNPNHASPEYMSFVSTVYTRVYCIPMESKEILIVATSEFHQEQLHARVCELIENETIIK